MELNIYPEGKPDDQQYRPVRIVVISDTHESHRELPMPDGDVLISCGDFTSKSSWHQCSGIPNSLKDFNEWMEEQPHKHKIIIAGNHELGFNDMKKEEIQEHLNSSIYLQDSGIELEGIKFYGSPWTTSHNMGFSGRASELKKKWKKIPKKTNIVITHLPPFNILDLAFQPSKI